MKLPNQQPELEVNMNDIEVIRDQNGIVSITMPRPSNLHAHLRDDSDNMMRSVAFDTMRWVKYLLVMPNTGPIDSIEKVRRYHDELTGLARFYQLDVTFIMTLYFTAGLTPDVIEHLVRLPFRCAVKWYPPHQGATTGSGLGVHFRTMSDTLRAMARCGVPFLGHFESVYDKNGQELPHAEREGYFIQHEFPWLREEYPDMRICIEHASTELAVQTVLGDTSGNTVCTITSQHLLFTSADLTIKSWRNHLKCMPFVKTLDDRRALIEIATSGDRRVILGDDSAPHPSKKKDVPFVDAACGCWLPHSLSLYAMAFDKAGALDSRFIKFACINGPQWWDLEPPSKDDHVIIRRELVHDIPKPTPIVGSNDVIVPLGWTTHNDRLRIGLALSEV